jgi:hypothetical protein
MGLSGFCRRPARSSSLHPSPRGSFSLRANGAWSRRHPLTILAMRKGGR